MAEFIAQAKAKPGSLTYASAGNGSENHLMGELLKSLAGIDIVHVPYKGGAPAVIAAIGGEVSSVVADPLAALSPVKAGKLRALAVTSGKRVKSLPNIPTIAESGVRVTTRRAGGAPSCPKGHRRRSLRSCTVRSPGALKDPAISERLSSQLYEPVGNLPEEFAALIKSENEKWSKLIKQVGLRID